jgi:hypothetical protein
MLILTSRSVAGGGWRGRLSPQTDLATDRTTVAARANDRSLVLASADAEASTVPDEESSN